MVSVAGNRTDTIRYAGYVTLRLYDTATRTQRDFVPLTPGKVGIYICGLTTQGTPHIGHLRFAVAFDILRRWLAWGHGYDVTLVRNVTDIDDKILRKSAENDRPWWAWSYAHERETSDALRTLGVIDATYEPRATGHIPEMVELMERLIELGHAYPAEDGSGDVYFDVRSYPEYGALTRQKVEDMSAAEDADPRGKRDPRDFALWKGFKQGEPETASWPTPYGRGRPGWHLECSAMARKYLGDAFDIHGGGVDLRFPHHENEQAQSRAAGYGFAQYWMHNGWLTAGGEKMSKSLGNGMTIAQITTQAAPLAVRYYLGASQYRSTIEYYPTSLEEAASAAERITGFLNRCIETIPELEATALVLRTGVDIHTPDHLAVPDAFAAAMNDDLNVPGALAVVHDTLRAGNVALDKGDTAAAHQAAIAVGTMTTILGINPLDSQWDKSGSSEQHVMDVLDGLIRAQLQARATARKNKDFATADAIRDTLTSLGVVVEDTPSGARWTLAKAGA
ncbi:cysteine--tRNA ligase [Dermatophilus congolensis]|nr:cysteine--tRNA ligase [Dermatophilus congolensis]MBO3151063.1 cysteine--tRNA ligase [Dermatophilus congolensis]MBO3161932.1 cysteine--tRNA ligase [Dermatophilus congolensis]MBO3162350.1 cysteine--tRNA ligase [Dermatophilus congolensis]MBO3175904.1 cysteine--tRNA ligase [Dermatophilus congolensis]